MALAIEGGFAENAGAWAYSLKGEVDISNAHQMKRIFDESYAKKPANIVVDLSGLSYLDSTGLGVLIGIYGSMRSSGHRIILAEPRENVKKLLTITNLDKVFC
jgi:anti-sigma B factor antagonist